MTDQLQPDDLREGMDVRVEWSPRGGPGRGDAAEGRVTRVWRPDDEVEQFTVETEGTFVNVYADYRNPVVERVEEPDGEDDPDSETVGRLDALARADAA